jgi:hypothetical protein
VYLFFPAIMPQIYCHPPRIDEESSPEPSDPDDEIVLSDPREILSAEEKRCDVNRSSHQGRLKAGTATSITTTKHADHRLCLSYLDQTLDTLHNHTHKVSFRRRSRRVGTSGRDGKSDLVKRPPRPQVTAELNVNINI